MAQAVPVNSDLPSSVLIPGFYFRINLSGGGGGLNSPITRLLLIGNKLASGTAAQDTVVQVTNQTDANAFFGRGSDLARLYAAAASQINPGACDIFCLPIVEPSAGTASTHLISIAGPATSSGSISATIAGYTATAAIASADTATAIAANLNTAIQAIKDLPCTANAVSGTITLTYPHKGLVGNDLPIIVNINGASGVTASPGTIGFSGTAVGVGSIALYVGGTTITGTVANSDTAAVIAATLNTAINAGGYPVSSTVSTTTVTLFYVNDRVVHRINAGVLTSTGVTTTVTCGVLGAGSPSLTNALTNLQAQAQFPIWCTSFNDGGATAVALGTAGANSFHGAAGGGGSSSLGALKTHIATYADGYNQKGQQLMWGTTEALAVSGSYQTNTGWQTTSDAGEGRGSQLWQVDCPQQAYELAARAAAYRISQSYKPKNYSGVVLQTKGTVPLLGPHRAVRSGPADQNAALLTYYMTPVVYDDTSNTHKIVRGRTTSPNSDQRLWAWGTLDTLDYIRYDMNGFLSTLFSGKSFKASGLPPRTPNTITTRSIADAVAERLRTYDAIDFVDDVDNLVKSLSAAQDAIVVNRVNVFLPMRIPVELDQVAGNIALS
jgi:phage tail sheath gpL-like